MKKYFKIYPEVPGGMGQKTTFDKNRIPWGVEYLHIHFDGWSGCDLLNVSPVYFVTEKLKNALEAEKLTGYKFSSALLVEKSDLFEELYPKTELPNFWRLEIDGILEKDDFGKTTYSELVVSQKALKFLRKFDLGIAEISIFIKG